MFHDLSRLPKGLRSCLALVNIPDAKNNVSGAQHKVEGGS